MKTKPSHTPGPAEAIEDAIAWLCDAPIGSDQLERGQALAKHKKLLKAAPDLLEAAKHFGSCPRTGQEIEFRCKKCVSGRAAIARAEGGK